MLFQRKRLFSSFVTLDFNKRQNRNETSFEEQNQIYWNICFFGDKIVNTLVLKVQTRAMLEQKMIPIKNELFRTIKKNMTLAAFSR